MSDVVTVLTRWVKWHDLVDRRTGACTCGKCLKCRAKAALTGPLHEMRGVLFSLLAAVSVYRGDELRACDCGQCLECQARAALRGNPVVMQDRKLTAHYAKSEHQKGRHDPDACDECQRRAAHGYGSPMDCPCCGTPSRFWNGRQWRCLQRMRQLRRRQAT